MSVVGKHAKLLKVKNYRFTLGLGVSDNANELNGAWGP